MNEDFGPLVDGARLAEHLREPGLRVIDFRWSLESKGKGRRAYEAGHIPGAAFLDLESGVTGAGGAGRHPLPKRDDLETAIRHAGVDAGDRVVVYDDAGGSVASRLWWLLRAHGHDRVAILDGGIGAWTGPLETDVPEIPPGNFAAAVPDYSDVLAYDDVRLLGDHAVLIDVRSPDRYRGEVEPVDPVAGHIPGARNAFWAESLDERQRLRSPSELRERFEALGVRPGNAVLYCGSGVTSCHTKIAIERAGLGPVRLYAGSWSDWVSRPGAEVATGGD